MESSDLSLKVTEHEVRLNTLDAQMRKVEDQQRAIQDLTLSVHDLAKSVSEMVLEQKKQDDRLEKLENVPKERWSTIQKSVLTAVISVVVGALTTGLLWAILNNIK